VIEALAARVGSEEPPTKTAREPGFHPYDEIDELWEELPLSREPPAASESGRELLFDEPVDEPPSSPASALVTLLGPAPISPDDLARQSGLPIRAVHGILLELELAGKQVSEFSPCETGRSPG
jgi:predicted Rossmann fold nucleotide-binding protein DprA/Smf involved in DNA uptake